MENTPDPLLSQAEAAADAKIKLYANGATYLVITCFLMAMNWWQAGRITWAVWPALGMSLAWLMQGVRTWFSPGPWRDRLVEQELQRLRQRNS